MAGLAAARMSGGSEFHTAGPYVCENSGKNRSRNVTVRVPQMDTLTDKLIVRQRDANRFYTLSHAICYSYRSLHFRLLITTLLGH